MGSRTACAGLCGEFQKAEALSCKLLAFWCDLCLDPQAHKLYRLQFKRMLPKIGSELRSAVADRIRYYNDLGIYDFYRRPVVASDEGSASVARAPSPAISEFGGEQTLMEIRTELATTNSASALRLIREAIGDCTRCRLHK